MNDLSTGGTFESSTINETVLKNIETVIK